jgi:hypothetical protein
MRRRYGLISLLVLVVNCVAVGCGSATPITSSCGGSHVWPPVAYASVSPPPSGVTIGQSAPAEVTVHNVSGQGWRFRIERWVDDTCVGYIAESPIESGVIEPGHFVQTNIDPGEADAGNVVDVKIGVAVFAPECDESCADPPVGFGWLDMPVVAPT